ncbi:hypothetical protein [Algivirga pacifica]
MNTRPPLDLHHFKNLRASGSTYPEIRRSMVHEGYTDEEISAAIRKIDEEELERVVRESQKRPLINFSSVGWPLLLIALVIAVYLYWIGDPSPMALAYTSSLLIASVYMLMIDQRQRKEKETED